MPCGVQGAATVLAYSRTTASPPPPTHRPPAAVPPQSPPQRRHALRPFVCTRATLPHTATAARLLTQRHTTVRFSYTHARVLSLSLKHTRGCRSACREERTAAHTAHRSPSNTQHTGPGTAAHASTSPAAAQPPPLRPPPPHPRARAAGRRHGKGRHGAKGRHGSRSGPRAPSCASGCGRPSNHQQPRSHVPHTHRPAQRVQRTYCSVRRRTVYARSELRSSVRRPA
jgi:hypothetical protein